MVKTNRKKELEKQIAKLEKQEKQRVEKICSSEEFQKLYKKGRALQGRMNKLSSETEKIKESITLTYLNDCRSPQYTTYSEYWGNDRRNIRKETLKGIKKGLGITNLSLLKASEIEGIVEKLINNKLKNNKEYQEKIMEGEKVEERKYDIEIKTDKLKEEAEGFWEKTNKLYNKLSAIEKREQEEKDLNNKEKIKRTIRWKKEEEAREKLKNVFNKLEEIHNEVIKERIVTNLEEEKETDYFY